MHTALRSAMAFNMKGIIAQKLLKSIKPGVGRVPTVEIMIFNANVRKLILEEKDDKLADAIRIGKEEGMQDFTMSLKQLVDEELIDREVAMEVAPEPRGAEDGPQGHRSKGSGNYLMRRWLSICFLCACASVVALPRAEVRAQDAARRRCGRSGRGGARAVPRPLERPHSIPRLKSPSISWLKLASIWLLFLLWVRSADWVNRDSQLMAWDTACGTQ